jgi:hypothetical protein
MATDFFPKLLNLIQAVGGSSSSLGKIASGLFSTKNKGGYISLSYDAAGNSPVKYNLHNYNVEEIRIYSPSLHTYMNKPACAEIIIIHNTPSGGNKLAICVPIKNEVSTSKGSVIINKIIMGTVSKAPKNTASATLNDIGTYTLNNIVPIKKFFSYSGQEIFDDCSSTFDYIVFSPNVSNVAIDSDCLTKLQKIITNSNIKSKSPSVATPLFINEKGPNRGQIDEGIFIDCQTVGESGEETVVNEKTQSNNNSASDFFDIENNPWVLGFFIFLMCIGLIILLNFYGNGGISKIFGKMNLFGDRNAEGFAVLNK